MPPLVVKREARKPQLQTHLLKPLAAQGDPGKEPGHGRPGPGRTARAFAERGGQFAEQFLPVKMAGQHHQRPLGRIGPRDIIPQRVGRDGLHGLRAAANRPPERRLGPDSGAERLVGQILPDILVHGHLLEDHPPFQLEIGRIEAGMEQHIEQDIENPAGFGRMGIRGEHLRVIAGVQPGRIGVEGSAERIDFLGNLPGGPGLRSFEQHMFGKMGYPLPDGIFIKGPRLHPDIHRGGQRVLFGEKQDPQAVLPFDFFHGYDDAFPWRCR